MDVHNGLVSGVTKHPLKVSIPTSGPHSTSTTALYTSPPFPLLRWTATSLALMRLSVDSCARECPSSCAVVDEVRGSTETGFQAEEEYEDSRARK
jgi:hypothetical protein